MVMTSWVLWVSGGHPHPRVRRVKPGDGTSVMVAPGKNHLKQSSLIGAAEYTNLTSAHPIRVGLPCTGKLVKPELRREPSAELRPEFAKMTLKTGSGDVCRRKAAIRHQSTFYRLARLP